MPRNSYVSLFCIIIINIGGYFIAPLKQDQFFIHYEGAATILNRVTDLGLNCQNGFGTEPSKADPFLRARSARLGEHAKTEQVVGRDGGRRKQSDERHRRLTAGARRAPANQSTACGSRADFFRSPGDATFAALTFAALTLAAQTFAAPSQSDTCGADICGVTLAAPTLAATTLAAPTDAAPMSGDATFAALTFAALTLAAQTFAAPSQSDTCGADICGVTLAAPTLAATTLAAPTDAAPSQSDTCGADTCGAQSK
ncbi:hypothetical protein niasHT_013226 [Heterodera trifolii]|uniref:Uncharacterized protein n=1 Tax=Heterodera trifolii TaxID=157864 RepID=A0ABD2KY39_9BILA